MNATKNLFNGFVAVWIYYLKISKLSQIYSTKLPTQIAVAKQKQRKKMAGASLKSRFLPNSIRTYHHSA